MSALIVFCLDYFSVHTFVIYFGTLILIIFRLLKSELKLIWFGFIPYCLNDFSNY